jgi:multiple sugar transport system substrate-binding protein
MRRAAWRTAIGGLGCALVLAVAGCGAGNGPAGSRAAHGEAGSTAGAPVAPTLAASRDAHGTVDFCTGKDFSGAYARAVEQFNHRHRGQDLGARLVEFPISTDEQRQQAILRLQTRSAECDVYQADPTWIAEFARQRWVMDMTAYVRGRADDFIGSTLAPFRYDGRYWGVPQFTGVGLLYRRTDHVATAPTTWQEVYRDAAAHEGIAYQGAAYEGLTVNFLELAYAAGGRVLSEDGTRVVLNSPANLAALELMVDGVESGAAPRAVTTYLEEPTRFAFEAGRVTFMRNWPYAYPLAAKAPEVGDRFAVSPLPAFEGGHRGGVLGGNGPVLSAFSDNPRAGMLLIDHLTSARTLEEDMAVYFLPSVLDVTYESPAVRRAIPFADTIKQAIEEARPRPVSPVYPEITQAIHDNVNAALTGRLSPPEALEQAQRGIGAALNRF